MDITRNPWLQASRQPLHLRVVDSGFARLGTDWFFSGMRSPFNRLYYIVDGEGSVAFHGQRVTLQPMHVYLVPAELTFDHACAGHMQQLFFHINVLPSNGLELFRTCPKVLSLPTAPEHMEALLQLYRSETALDAFALQTHLRMDILRFLHIAGLSETALGVESPLVTAVFQAASTMLSARLTIRDLADTLALSSSALSRRFRQEAGLSLGRYIDGLLLQEAQRLLATTDLPIGEIAEQLAFCDQFYFSRYFKQRQGETPTQYRRKHLLHI